MSTASPSADVAVLVGRFQPLHDAHRAPLARALAIAPRCVVVIGSAFQARTPRNPFTGTERRPSNGWTSTRCRPWRTASSTTTSTCSITSSA